MWKVVPISDYQLLDVREEDLLNEGDFRKCETYRGGGGYDQFPAICEKRIGKRAHKQFIAQLYGCNLDCPYCYVTRSGVWGTWKVYDSNELIKAFLDSEQEVFHLMGGAPALYLEQWPELMSKLPRYAVFHSDLLLTEKPYDREALRELGNAKDYALFALDVKGVTPEDYQKNTRKPFKADLFWSNWELLEKYNVPYYVTYTDPDMNHYDAFVHEVTTRFGSKVLEDSFIIPLIDYDATPYVDILPAKTLGSVTNR